MKTLLLTSLLLLLVVVPAGAEEPGTVGVEPAALDPVIASVVRMLEQKVPVESISTWLDQVETPPTAPSPDDLIALTRAGAPEELIQKILGLATAVKTPSLPEPEREQTQPAGPAYPMKIELGYSPAVVEYQLEPWDLYLYIDGRPIARADGWAGHSKSHNEWVIVDVPLLSGPHQLQLLQEKHALKSKKKGTWTHEARVVGDGLHVELDTHGYWRLRIAAKEGATSYSGLKVQFELTRDGETVDSGRVTGLSGKALPPLCDDTEATLTQKQRSTKAGRAAMRNCIRWASLWDKAESFPERSEVLDEMKEAGFDVESMASR